MRGGGWFFDCLFPKNCFDCGAEGGYWCLHCQAKTRLGYPNICFGCQKLAEDYLLCHDCQPRYAFDGILIASDYDDELTKAFIRSYKYRFVTDLSFELSLILRQKIDSFLMTASCNAGIHKHFFTATVLAVPLSKKRLRFREFNQAELLAKHIATYCGLEYRSDLIYRTHRPPQAKLKEAERQKNLQGSFFVQGESPPLVILVDDVVTTGATLHESAKVLKQAGAKEVWGLVVAKG